MAHTITYEGVEVAYDHKALHSWSVQRALTGADGPTAMYDAIDRLLCGRSAEVADALGDDADAMVSMIAQLVAVDPIGKN